MIWNDFSFFFTLHWFKIEHAYVKEELRLFGFLGEVEDISEAEIYGNIFNVVCEWKLH